LASPLSRTLRIRPASFINSTPIAGPRVAGWPERVGLIRLGKGRGRFGKRDEALASYQKAFTLAESTHPALKTSFAKLHR